MKRLPLIALAALTACGTPQEQCITRATSDARIVSTLIAETKANLARGYRLHTIVVLEREWADCTPPATAENPSPQQDMCLIDVPAEVTRPVAIDLNAEAAKLASLQAKQAAQAREAEAAIAECKALHPQ